MRSIRIALLPLLLLASACGDDDAPPPPPDVRNTPVTTAGQPLSLDELGARLTALGLDGKHLVEWRRVPAGVSYALPVTAEGAIDAWKQVRPETDALGHYPIVVKDPDGEFLGYLTDDEPTPKKTLRVAATIELPLWFGQRVAGDPEYYANVPLGEWAPGEPQDQFTVPYDLEGRPAKGLKLVLVPTTRPWEAVAWLHFGGWNECPAPETHVAVHRYWHRKYGAELVCITRDVMEMRVAKPPKGRSKAKDLAYEQFVYSGGDLVFQGSDSLRALAASLIDAPTWYFWWD